MYKLGQIVSVGGLPNVVVSISVDYDPYLWYCGRVEVKSVINGTKTSFADTSMLNPHCDIKGVLNGTVKSMYA